MITDQRPVLLPEVSGESFWRPLIPGEKVSSWLGAPLVIAHHALGVLCAEASEANVFTPAHLRVAGSMAISAAAAVQNARLYQRAEIYGSELEKRLLDLRRTQKALEQAEQERMISEEKFQAVFNSSPIAFSVTSLKEGIFLEVNRSFEQRYGYSRSELLGRTVYELLFWEDVADRNLMMTQLARGGSIRNLITRLRTKSGELKLTAYSADLIQFDGKTCVLAVTGDVPSTLPTFVN
jgi:PAS domain S-box-containing protein